jgi:hypothetical protein
MNTINHRVSAFSIPAPKSMFRLKWHEAMLTFTMRLAASRVNRQLNVQD